MFVIIIKRFAGSASCFSLACPMICTLMAVGLSLGTMSTAGEAKTSFEEDKILIENLYGNYKCGDSISSKIGEVMNVEVAGRSQSGVDGASYLQIFGILACLLSLVGGVLVCFIFLASGKCGGGSKSGEGKKSSSSSSS